VGLGRIFLGFGVFGGGVDDFWPDLPFERVELKSADLALTPIPHQNKITNHTPPNQLTSHEPHNQS